MTNLTSLKFKHALTIKYQTLEGNDLFPPVVKTLTPGTMFSIANPQREGYTSAPAVEGFMSSAHQTIIVAYAPKHFKLTVKYVDDSQTPEEIHEPTESFVAYGTGYTVSPLEIDGYETEAESVTGTMGEEDVEVTFTYSETVVEDPTPTSES